MIKYNIIIKNILILIKMMNKGLKQQNLIDVSQDTLREYDSCLVSSERNNNNVTNDIKKKRVKFIDKITIIDVECWKKYNMEQTADENFYDNNEDEEEDVEVKNETNDKTNNKKKKNKKDNVVCTCNII